MKIPDTDGSISEFYKYLKKKNNQLYNNLPPEDRRPTFLSDARGQHHPDS